MKLETFFEKFELFSDAPNAVAKMRELVLQLATSGRIADQDPSDQPAAELLSEIFEIRDHLLSTGKVRRRVEGSMITAGDSRSNDSLFTGAIDPRILVLESARALLRHSRHYGSGSTARIEYETCRPA